MKDLIKGFIGVTIGLLVAAAEVWINQKFNLIGGATVSPYEIIIMVGMAFVCVGSTLATWQLLLGDN